jgi:arylsulfatase A-like enzyme
MMARIRQFVGCLLPLAALCLTNCPGLLNSADGARPNLLIIHVDELNFRELGCYGGKIVDTVHIDRLAAGGARCDRFYATTPVCSPSRAAFVSGLYPHHTPVVTNNIPLNDDIVTFAELLRRQGYKTGYAGKWHLDGTGKPQWAPEREFGFEDNRFMFNRGHWKKLELGTNGPAIAARNKKGDPSYDVAGADEKSFTTDWLTDRTIEFLEANHKEPFCYMLSLPDPHGPNTVRPPYDTMYADVKVPIPSTLTKSPEQTPKWAATTRVTADQLARIMPQYYGMIKCIDDNVGRLLAALKKHDLSQNTIVVFTADHGDLCGEHSRLNKGVPYEGSAKIPMVIYYPRRVKAGQVVSQALSCVDFAPTILNLMEVKTDQKFHGRDAHGFLTGSPPPDWHDVAFMRGTQSWLSAVTGRYKLVCSINDEPWLFDLENDPDELHNVYKDPAHRQVAKLLRGELKRYTETFGDPRGEEATIKAQLGN